MKEDKTEQRWDKLLHIRTSGRMILTRISTDIPTSQHHILYCNALRIPGISESTICCWIMAAEKGGWISFCPGRPDVSLSGLNMMSASMKMHRKIKRQQFLPDGYLLKSGCDRIRCPGSGGQDVFF